MWGNTGSLFIRSEELKPLQFALQQISIGGLATGSAGSIGGGGTTALVARMGASAAVSFFIAAVPIMFFLVCQSYILETMTTSGIKE
jgi:ABC-type glycerol-3-phosphate transport system permease component